MPARPVVLHLFTSLNIGGMERQTLQLVRLLGQSGNYVVKVASLTEEGLLKQELEELGHRGFPSYPLRTFRSFHATHQIWRFAAFLRRSRITIVHTHDFYTNTFGILAAILAQVPIRVASRRELDVFSPWQRRVERIAYRAAQCVVANCAFLQGQLIREGLSPAKSEVLPNSIDSEPLPAGWEQNHSEVLRSFGLPRGGRLVTMVANLHNTRKDPVTFAIAASQITKRFSDVVFVLAGSGLPNPELREVIDTIPEGRFFLLGGCLRVPELLALSEICVLCSYSEGMPNTILEYMAAGRPVVASDVGGVSEAIAQGETGYLVCPHDGPAIAERVAFLLSHPDVARQMGIAGRERVRQYFSPGQQLSRAIEIYSRLLRECVSQ